MRVLPLLALLFVAGCPKKTDGADAGPIAITSDKADPTTVADGIRPILEDKGEIDPRAKRICRSLHGVVAERQFACCNPGATDGGRSPIEPTCASAVSAVLKANHVVFDDAKLAACEAAQVKSLEGCGWVRAAAPRVPDTCNQLI